MIRVFTVFVLAMVMLFPVSLSALKQSEIEDSFKTIVAAITDYSSDSNMTKEHRDNEVLKLIEPVFDFDKMAKLSLGKKAYRGMSKDDQKRYIELYTKKVESSYLKQLDLYSGEKIGIESLERVKKRIYLSTYIYKNGDKKKIIYKFYNSKKRGWVVYDVDVLGVSIVQTYRSQFASELKRGSVETLLEKLRID